MAPQRLPAAPPPPTTAPTPRCRSPGVAETPPLLAPWLLLRARPSLRRRLRLLRPVRSAGGLAVALPLEEALVRRRRRRRRCSDGGCRPLPLSAGLLRRLAPLRPLR